MNPPEGSEVVYIERNKRGRKSHHKYLQQLDPKETKQHAEWGQDCKQLGFDDDNKQAQNRIYSWEQKTRKWSRSDSLIEARRPNLVTQTNNFIKWKWENA